MVIIVTKEMTNMTNMLGVAEAKAKLSEILDRVREKGERYIIQRRGKPVAAVVPLEDLPIEQRVVANDWVTELLNLGPEGAELAEAWDEIVRERSLELPPTVNLGDE